MMHKTICVLAILTLWGCQEKPTTEAPKAGPPAILAAKLDTLPILQRDPEYQKLSEQYTVSQIALRKRIDARYKKGEFANDNEAAQAYLKEQGELNKKWMNKTNDFILTRHTKMREAVREMCEEKKIDMVLIDSVQYRTVAYGAFDITQDVLMKLYGNSLGGTPAPAGTPQ